MSQHKNGISAMELMRTLDLSRYETAWLISHKIREAMIQRDNIYNLRDNIELDDTYFGGKSSGRRGRGSENKKIVIVGIEVDSKKSIHSKAKVIDNIKKYNIPYSIICAVFFIKKSHQIISGVGRVGIEERVKIAVSQRITGSQ